MRVLASQDGGAARAAERRRRERVQEAGALARQAIDVRCLDERVTGDPNVIPAEVVHEDDDDVRSPGGDSDIRESGDCQEQEEEGQKPLPAVREGACSVQVRINSLAISAKTAVCRSTSSSVVAGDMSAMLWKGVIRMPRFSIYRCM